MDEDNVEDKPLEKNNSIEYINAHQIVLQCEKEETHGSN